MAKLLTALGGKLLGSGLILGVTTYAGWQIAQAYARRPRHLRDLQTALAVLQTEVEYAATPLPQALSVAGRSTGEPVGALFTRAAERIRAGGGLLPGDALRGSLEDLSERTALQRQDLDVLLALAPVLGASGRSDQIRHLALARERLAREEEQAREERERYERLARSAGVLVGAALVFILW